MFLNVLKIIYTLMYLEKNRTEVTIIISITSFSPIYKLNIC